MSARALAVLACLVSLSASAQRTGLLEGKKIAVLEFSVAPGAKVQAPDLLSDDCRGAVAEVTKAEGAIVVTRENMLEILKVTGGKCQEGECEVETARNLGVDLFVTGSVTLLDGELMLSLKAYETRKGQLLDQKRVSAPKEKALLEQVKPVTAELVRNAFGLGKARSAAARVQPAAQAGSFEEAGKDVVVGEEEEVLAKFESDPVGASVRFDGELLCKATPCSKRVMNGRHEVVFEQERYSAARVNAVVKKGSVITGTLAPRFGWLTIESEVPGIAVTVDGVAAGKTPVNAREVDEGTVEVAVADACYVRAGERVAMKAGERRIVRLSSKPKIAGLKVNAQDDQGNDVEATVKVDGREAGEAGATLKVPVCSKQVSVRLGNREWMDEPKLEEGKVTVLTAKPGSGKSAGMVTVAGGGKVGTFKLDVTEVTVAAYAACVKAGKCSQPSTGNSYCTWNVSGKEQHPINCVDWNQATAFCAAQGKRLPTEEEWQWAASNGGRTEYPWGNDGPDESRAKWKSSDGTAAVGTHPSGATTTGLQDMAGNVWEWTSSDYDSSRKVLRGGSWFIVNPDYLRASNRFRFVPTLQTYNFGFRCAQ